MRSRHRSGSPLFATAISALFLLGAFAASPALAGKTQTGNEGGGESDPEPGSETDTSWNPSNHCVATPGMSIYALLACLANYIDPTFGCHPWNLSAPAGDDGPGGQVLVPYQPDPCQDPFARGDFRVTYLPPPEIGLSIVRWEADEGGSKEPQRLLLRENDHNIQWTGIEVNRPGLVARIHHLEGTPTGGSIQIAINGRALPAIVTTNRTRIGDLNQAVYSRILQGRFAVQNQESYFVVPYDALAMSRITSVSLRSTDRGIFKSELKLEPYIMQAPVE